MINGVGVEAGTGRRAVPLGRGGDRKTEMYRKAKNNVSEPFDLTTT